MDYTNAMMVWDAVSVRITDVRHGAIAGGQSELTGENGLFIFVLGKDVRVTIEDVPYAPRGDALFHVGRGRRVRLDTTGKAEYHCVAYHAEAPQAVGREMARLLWEEAPFDATIAVRPVDITAVLRSCEALGSAWKEAPPLVIFMRKQRSMHCWPNSTPLCRNRSAAWPSMPWHGRSSICVCICRKISPS